MPQAPVSSTQEPPTSSATASASGGRNVSSLCDNENGDLQIFLGGSCNPTTWRQTVAIPFLEMNGITYYNPQVDDWTPELVKVERHAKQSARLLLFVLDEQTRSTVSLIESAYMAGEGKRLVLVIYPFEFDVLSLTDTTRQTTSNIVETRKELTKTDLRSSSSHNQTTSSSILQATSSSSSSTVSSTVKHASGKITINGETISLAEFQELRQARFILQNLVDTRNTAMFSDIPQALDYVSSCLANDKDTQIEKPLISATSNKSDPMISTRAIRSTISGSDAASTDALKDVYLMLDNYDDGDIEPTLTIMLHERGLSYHCRPLKDVISQRRDESIPIQTRDPNLLLVRNTDELDRFSGLLDATSEKNTRSSLEREIETIERSRVLLFVITNKCRGLSIMVLASYFMALFRNNVVLCIQYLEEPCLINGELLTKNAIADYNRGRVYLCDYAIKSQVPVFETVREAVDCCSQRCGCDEIKS